MPPNFMQIILQTLLLQNRGKKPLFARHKPSTERAITQIWDESMNASLSVWYALDGWMDSFDQDSNTFTGLSVKLRPRLTTHRYQARAHNSSALKRVSLIKPGISVWAQEGRRVVNGNTFYLCFSETNISEAKLNFCNLQDTFKRGTMAKDPLKTLHWSRKITNEISLIIQLLLRHQ